jgi:hypothetical protein
MKVHSLAIATALLLLVAVPATASAARFQGRAMGNSARGYVPLHNFTAVGGGFELRFRDREQASTRYKLCAIVRGHFRGCTTGKTGAAGAWSSKSSFKIYKTERVEKVTWRWSVDGKAVARWVTDIKGEGGEGGD